MLFVVLLLCAVLGLSAPSSFGFSNVFGDHMVLQRGRVNPVWGFTSPGGSVSVEYSGGSPLSATARADGFWSVSLPSMKESFTPITITAADSAAGWKASLVDVLIGDVFFCSGQSNMQFPMNMINNATAEVQAANNYPGIRISSGPALFNLNLHTVTPGPKTQLAALSLPWSVGSNVTVDCQDSTCRGDWGYYSAACYLTLKYTFEALNGAVPLGGISQVYGGTSLQWWSSAEALAECDAPPGSSCCGWGGNSSCLYDTQIAPYTLGPTQLAGFLWYQGEQNAGCGGAPQIPYYNCGLQAFIRDIRVKFQQSDLVFGVFLLAAWQADTPWFPLLRLAQLNASVSVPNVFTASTLDAGDPAGGPVHSPFKQTPTHRAATALQSFVYGKDLPFLGPRMETSSIAGPSSVSITFGPNSLYGRQLVLNTSVSCPSTIQKSSCEAFAVQTADCQWYANVTASLGSNGVSLVLTLPTDAPNKTIVATRGLFGNWPVVQLYNGVGLPADPWLSPVSGVSNSCPPIGIDDDWTLDENLHA